MKGKGAHEVRMLEALEGLGSQQIKNVLAVLVKRSADNKIAQKTAGTVVFKWHD